MSCTSHSFSLLALVVIEGSCFNSAAIDQQSVTYVQHYLGAIPTRTTEKNFIVFTWHNTLTAHQPQHVYFLKSNTAFKTINPNYLEYKGRKDEGRVRTDWLLEGHSRCNSCKLHSKEEAGLREDSIAEYAALFCLSWSALGKLKHSTQALKATVIRMLQCFIFCPVTPALFPWELPMEK